MMRSLSAKLLLAFVAISVLSIALVGVFTWRSTTRRFETYVLGQVQERVIERWLDYYTVHGSWDGVREKLAFSRDLGTVPLPGPWGGRPESRSMVALVDSAGCVIVPGHGFGEGDRVPRDVLVQGHSITVDDQVIGIALWPQPRAPVIGADDFLRSFYTILLAAALTAVCAALGVGMVVSRSLTKPLREVTQATQRVTEGQLGLYIPVRSNDELGHLAHSFNQMSSKLARAEKSRRQMTADVAHELRTPLSLILGHAEALSEGLLPAEQETYDIIYDEAQRLARLVDDLRTLSLSDDGELQMVSAPVSLGELLNRTAAVHRPAAQAQGVQLEVDIHGDIVEMNADPDRIAQVLDNLVSNALRHTLEGGRVTLSAEQMEGCARITVRDTGAGIAAEDQDLIFERFYRVDSSRQRASGGSGVGLAIAKSIVGSHNGRIWVESDEGQGSCFIVEIPSAVSGIPCQDDQRSES